MPNEGSVRTIMAVLFVVATTVYMVLAITSKALVIIVYHMRKKEKPLSTSKLLLIKSMIAF